MIETKTIEYFVIEYYADDSMCLPGETFETFEEARSHINDINEKGKYIYSEPWTNAQTCKIIRYFGEPGMTNVEKTNTWKYRNGQLVEDLCYVWDEYHTYDKAVW